MTINPRKVIVIQGFFVSAWKVSVSRNFHFSPKKMAAGIEKILIDNKATILRREKAYKHALNSFTKLKMANSYISELKLR